MSTLVSKDTSGIYLAQEGEVELPEQRTRNFKKFHRGGRSYRVAGQIGPIHYRLDPLSEAEAFKEIDIDLRPGATCDFECTENGYQTEVWNELQNSVGEAVHYVAKFTRAGHWLSMCPIGLYWENDRRERETIGTLQPGIAPVVDNDAQTITWENAFGPGLHFRYNLSPDVFSKTLVIDSADALPAPTIQDRNIRLVLLLSITWDTTIIPDDQRFPEGFLPGELTPNESLFYVWQASLDSPTTFSFKRNEDPVFWWQTPRAWQSQDPEVEAAPDLAGYYWEVGISATSQYGAKFCVPWSTLQAASYPVFIDTAISEMYVVNSSDDGYQSATPVVITTSHNYYNWNVSGTMYSEGIFRGVPIPAGATIDGAALTVQCLDTTYDDIRVSYHVEMDVNPASINSADSHNISNRTFGSEHVDWINGGSGANDITSPDISNVVQELIDLPAWASECDIGILTHSISASVKGIVHSTTWYRFNCSYTEPPPTFISQIRWI